MPPGQTKRLGRKETKKGKQIKAVVRGRVIARIVAGTDGHEHARIKALRKLTRSRKVQNVSA